MRNGLGARTRTRTKTRTGDEDGDEDGGEMTFSLGLRPSRESTAEKCLPQGDDFIR